MELGSYSFYGVQVQVRAPAEVITQLNSDLNFFLQKSSDTKNQSCGIHVSIKESILSAKTGYRFSGLSWPRRVDFVDGSVSHMTNENDKRSYSITTHSVSRGYEL